MVSETVSVWVERPIEEVFEYGTSIERLPVWNGPLRAAWLEDEDEEVVGARYAVEAEMFLGRVQTVDAVISEYEPPTRACFETRSGLAYRSCRTFEAEDGGTRVTETLEADPGFLKGLLINPLVRRFAKTQGENLELLKERLETADEE